MQRKKKNKTRFLSLLLAALLLVITPMEVLASEAKEEVLSGTYEEIKTFANGLPTTIAKGEVLRLEQDYVMEAGQWFESIEGTLDGQGHTITLTDKPLANTVSGTIQNLGVNSLNPINLDGYVGTIAVDLSGTIQNCFSAVEGVQTGWSEPGGIVGTIKNGSNASILNSYYGAKITDSYGLGMYGGIIGANDSEKTVVKNCFFKEGTMNDGVAAVGDNKIIKENCGKKTASDFQTGQVTDLLNTNLPNTGFQWANPSDGSNQGMPVLVKADGTIPEPQPEQPEKEPLRALVEKYNQIQPDGYTADSWLVFAEAQIAAQNVLDDPDATKESIRVATENLEAAYANLKKEKPLKPVAPPADESQIIHITSEEELDQYATGTGYYVLDKDIILKDMFAPFGEFNGVLDGQGHTITISGDRPYVYENIGEQGVFQNICFTGTINDWEARGPVGKNLKGVIVNCFSDTKGKNACGFAKYLDGGNIINSYSISEGKKGVLVNKYKAGSFINTYWLDTMENSANIPQEALINSCAKSETEIKTKEFVALLNANKGDYGTSWGQNNTGYPYFGVDQEYNPDKPNVPENKYEVVFSPEKEVQILIENQMLYTSPDEAGSDGTIGYFQLKNVPKTSKIEWGITDVKPEGVMMIGMEDGCLAYKKDAIPGSAIVKATEIKADGSTEEVAWIQVISKAKTLVDIQLLIDGNNVTNGTFEVAGSEEKKIEVRAKYEGSEAYIPVNPKQFTYTIKDETMIHSFGTSAFSFKKPGTSGILVASKRNPEIKANVEITSSYVPVVSVKPGISGKKVLHGVDANDYINYAFNPEYSTVSVEPGNASYAGEFTVESSNPEIAKYTGTGGYIASKAGKVTYTAKITQKDPESGKVSTISGTTEVHYTYQNPLTEIIIPNNKISMNLADKKQPLDITFKGEHSKDGWNVTFPNMKWTYDKEGIVSIGKTEPGYWKKKAEDEGKPDYGLFVSGDRYEVTPLKAGTVKVTGTPLDKTNKVEPITFTITVVGEGKPQTDIDTLVKDGLKAAEKHFADKYPTQDYKYNNNDWVVYGLLRAGKTIPEDKLNEYYTDIEKKVEGWKDNQKPTNIERVMIVLQIMKKDITNVGGKNLVQMLCDHAGLQAGSNELGWALIALDMKGTEIPDGAKWNRDTMISELLKFQTESGGFGLSDAKEPGIDTTAMALQALAPYKATKPEVAEAIEKGLSYLKAELPENCNYGNAEAIAQVILTLTTLGIDPVKSEFGSLENNMIRALMDSYYSENGFGHINNVPSKYVIMPSVQAYQALTAYVHFKQNENTYWDLKEKPQPEPKPEAAGTVSLMIMDGISKKGKETKGVILDEKVSIYSDDTMMSIIERACKEYKIEISIRDGSYIEMLDGLAEFDRGSQSGWKGTLDGKFPEKSFAECTVRDGEVKDQSVLTVEYTENLGKDLEENADMKDPGLKDGKLKEAFKRDVYKYTLVTKKDTISFEPAFFSRYAAFSIEADGKMYGENQSIPVKDNLVIKLTSRKDIRGEDVKTYEFTISSNAPAEKPPVSNVLVNKKYGVSIMGEGITEGMELVITPLGKEHKDVERMRKEVSSKKSIFKLYDVKLLKNGKEISLPSKMMLSIPVGKDYEGKELVLLHCLKDKVEQNKGKVKDGILSVEVETLGSFGVVIDTPKAETNGSGNGGSPTGGSAAKTGDETQIEVVLLCMVMAIMTIYNTYNRRKVK